MPIEGPFIQVNPDHCVGCHTCEIACATAHTKADSLIGALLGGERLQPRNHVIQIDNFKLSTQCRQCEDAPCVQICPTGATYRTDTYTAVNPERCVGCRMCMLSCPFGAINLVTIKLSGREKRAVIKCDLCVGRAEGPACVKACPTKSLSLVYPIEVMKQANEDKARHFVSALQKQKAISK